MTSQWVSDAERIAKEAAAKARIAALEEAAAFCDKRRYECGCGDGETPLQCRHCDEAEICAGGIRALKARKP